MGFIFCALLVSTCCCNDMTSKTFFIFLVWNIQEYLIMIRSVSTDLMRTNVEEVEMWRTTVHTVRCHQTKQPNKKRVWERDSERERGDWETVVLSIKFVSNLESEISWFRPRPCPKCTAGKAESKAKQNVNKQIYEAKRRQKAADDRKRNRFNGSRYRARHSGLSVMCVYLHSGLPTSDFITFPKYFGKFVNFFLQ